MREAQIHAMHEANARRNALMFSQWEFLNNRLLAFERVVFQATLRQRIAYFFSPEAFLAEVDKVHLQLQAEGKHKMEEAARKPTLTLVGANGR